MGGAGDRGGQLVAVGQGEGCTRSPGDTRIGGARRHDKAGISVVCAIVSPFVAVGRDGEVVLDSHVEGADFRATLSTRIGRGVDVLSMQRGRIDRVTAGVRGAVRVVVRGNGNHIVRIDIFTCSLNRIIAEAARESDIEVETLISAVLHNRRIGVQRHGDARVDCN